MKVAYPVIFTKTNDYKDTYLAYIPDFDGATEGHGLADAIHMAKDYIECMLYDKAENEYPKPSNINDINPNDGIFEGKSKVLMVDIAQKEKER